MYYYHKMKVEDREIIYDVKKENGLSIGELEGLMRQWQKKLEMKAILSKKN